MRVREGVGAEPWKCILINWKKPQAATAKRSHVSVTKDLSHWLCSLLSHPRFDLICGARERPVRKMSGWPPSTPSGGGQRRAASVPPACHWVALRLPKREPTGKLAQKGGGARSGPPALGTGAAKKYNSSFLPRTHGGTERHLGN